MHPKINFYTYSTYVHVQATLQEQESCKARTIGQSCSANLRQDETHERRREVQSIGAVIKIQTPPPRTRSIAGVESAGTAFPLGKVDQLHMLF